MDERKCVEGTNATRDKPMSPDSSARPEHAAWENGGDVLLSAQPTHAAWQNGSDVLLSAQLTHAASVRPAPVRSTAQERERTGQRNCFLTFRGGRFGPLPGTRDWSMVRVCSSSPPMGCWHVLLTGPVRVLVKRGEGKRRRLSVHHHCMNTGPPATPSDTHLTSDYQTTWLNMHFRGSGLILYLITH